MTEYSIQVKNVSKKFRLYHEKRTSLYEEIIGYFNRKKHYESLQVLDDVSFSVKKGEMFGIRTEKFEGVIMLRKDLLYSEGFIASSYGLDKKPKD